MINKEYEDIIKAAVAGGEVLEKYFGEILDITVKSRPSDVRTQADLGSENAILEILSEKFPTYNIFAEESGENNKNSEYTFVIDPLDGTNNFVLGIPYFSVGIGLIKEDKIIFGVVYNPILKNLYVAQEGRGAFLNDKKICVNTEASMENSSVSLVVEYGDLIKLQERLTETLNRMGVKRCLTNWSCLLDFCLLASGKIEAIVFHDCPLHDFVPGKLIAKEAGAMITDFNGNMEKDEKSNTFLTTNGTKIHKELLEILKK